MPVPYRKLGLRFKNWPLLYGCHGGGMCTASPYIDHPIALMHCCALTAASPVILAAFALHDTIEDTETAERP